jgi:hypothetical protein
VRSRDTITVAATDAGTALTYDAELRLTGAMRLLDKGLQLSFTTMSEKATAGLKKALGG